jgi:hypothetical protein
MSDNHGILPDTVAALIEGGLTIDVDDFGLEVLRCPVCSDRLAARSGWGPHKNGHLRAAGLLPPVVGKPRKPKPERRGPGRSAPERASPSPVPARTMSVEDGCIGLLLGLTGRAEVPLSAIADISAWIEATRNLTAMLETSRSNGKVTP